MLAWRAERCLAGVASSPWRKPRPGYCGPDAPRDPRDPALHGAKPPVSATTWRRHALTGWCSPVVHQTIEIDGIEIFYREGGPPDAPAVLLPHAMSSICTTTAPSSGCGSPCAHPSGVIALILQNGDIYEDEFGPRYEALRGFWANPTPEGRERLAGHVSEEGFRDEFVQGLPEHRAARVSPDLWKLHWPLMDTPQRRENVVGLLEDQATTIEWFPGQQAFLREHRPPTLIVWGPHDGYMPEGAARAYLRDLPDAELHLLDGGHWALETNLGEIVALTRDFLGRVDT
jgi:hypothetical protein